MSQPMTTGTTESETDEGFDNLLGSTTRLTPCKEKTRTSEATVDASLMELSY